MIKKYNVLKSKKDYYDKGRPYGLEKRSLSHSRYKGWKNRPDIALEFHKKVNNEKIKKGGIPKIFTFDPTLGSPKNSVEKYEYKDSIRHFDVKENGGKSKKIVESAWGIWPGKPDGNKWVTMESDDGSMEHGFIHLRAESESIQRLPETIQTILEARGVL